VVFTLPGHLNELALQDPRLIYNLLFSAAWGVIRDFGANPRMLGARMGMIVVLHTWGQNLSLHPHLHCIVPAGGLNAQGKWKTAKSRGKYLFPVKAMSKVFRARFVEGLRKQTAISPSLGNKLFEKPWVIYAKRPFFGPRQVIEYLGRYTHKIAISNHRIKSVKDGKIIFSYKDYRSGAKQKLMELEAPEFLRRFCLHILPKGYRKIRHYGFLASRNKPKLRIQQFLKGIHPAPKDNANWKQLCLEKLNYDVDACPCCRTGKMIRLLSFEANAPPSLTDINKRQKEVSERIKELV